MKAKAIINLASVSCAQISGLRAIEGERAHTWRVELTTEADLKSAINTRNGVRKSSTLPTVLSMFCSFSEILPLTLPLYYS